MSDPIDDMLHRTGQRWRDAQPAAPTPDHHRWHTPAHTYSGWRRGWIPVTAAAVVTAVIAATGYALTRGPAPLAVPPSAPQSTPAPSGASARPPDPTTLIVRDGDKVTVTGVVLAKPGQPVKLCAPTAQDLDLRPSDEPGVPRCTISIPVTGIDVDTLAPPTASGARVRNLRLHGIWQAGALAVTDQATPDPEPVKTVAAIPPPCPAPTGGWPNLGGGLDTNDLHRYVHEQHPDQFATPWIAYPDGFPPESTQFQTATVLVVEVVTGDIAAARAELDRLFDGSLCVVAARPGIRSIAEVDRVAGAMWPLLNDGVNGIWSSGSGNREGVVYLHLMMLTAQLYDKLDAIGLDALRLEPWIVPAS
jgi:hypothetical protein